MLAWNSEKKKQRGHWGPGGHITAHEPLSSFFFLTLVSFFLSLISLFHFFLRS